jgi:biopolymer transport protein ExbB/TolQ
MEWDVMDDMITIAMKPTKGFSGLAKSLRVAAAVTGEGGTISWPLTADEARAFANALERLETFPGEVKRFQKQADEKLEEMRKANNRGLFVASLYLAGAVLFFCATFLS